MGDPSGHDGQSCGADLIGPNLPGMKIGEASQIMAGLVLALGLTGCGGPVPAPIVDMHGVDQAKYNEDLADCVNNQPAFAFGNPVTKCMKAKGYKILVGY